jgi:inhibitor of cysteine peptidase
MIKNYIKFLCYGLLFVVASAYAENEVTVTDPANTIIVNQSNPTFNVILQSNPTTGYSWVLKKYDADLILYVEHKFYPPTKQKSNLVGAPCYEKWVFKVKPNGFTVPQLTNIILVYMRPWEGKSDKIITFKVLTKITKDSNSRDKKP